MLKLSVYRARASLAYKRDHKAGNGWHNNDTHNSLDTFTLQDTDTGTILFTCKAQTVANAEGLIAGVSFRDTIAPGAFQLRAFVEPRVFKCQPHGLCNCQTRKGDYIGADSITPTNFSRWLVHDWRNHEGIDTRVAWSAGCFVLADADLDRFNAILRLQGINPGNLIDGILEEEGES